MPHSAETMPASDPVEWTPETRFGVWFQGTDIWTRYVVSAALEELRQLMPESSPTNCVILDAGCGGGNAIPILERLFAPRQIIGIDIDAQLVALAEVFASEVKCDVELLHGDVRAMPLADKSVDAVLCHQTLHHVSGQGQALEEFRRVLKPDGILLLAESCRAFTESILVNLLFRHPPNTQHDANGFLNLIEAAGFEVRPDQMSNPDPWWARPAMGLWQRLGIKSGSRRVTQLCIAASLTPA